MASEKLTHTTVPRSKALVLIPAIVAVSLLGACTPNGPGTPATTTTTTSSTSTTTTTASPLPVCEVPEAPVLTLIRSNEVLTFTIADGSPIELAVIASDADPGDALYEEASTLSLAAYEGQVVRVLARSGGDCDPEVIFDATYDVRAQMPKRPGVAGTDSVAVARSSGSVVGWATGYEDFVPGADVTSNWTNNPGAALGGAGGLLPIGNGGRITLTFGTPIANGSGYDFAVFENGFFSPGTSETMLFAELAYIEVSSNGTDFVRFDSASQQPTSVGAFASQDVRLLSGLAGREPANYGSVFDLTALANKAAVRNGTVDLNHITHVRVVDIVGARDYPNAGDTYLDSFGRDIYDAHKTTGSGGYDLAGIAVLNQAPVAAE